MADCNDVLMKEWDICEQAIARFDNLHFQVRGWAVSAFGVLIGVAITANEPKLPILACAVTFAFWLVEANFKSYQLEFIERTATIQHALRHARNRNCDVKLIYPLIADQFERRKKNKCVDISRFLYAFAQFNVWLPYVLLITAALAFSFYLMGHADKPLIVELKKQPAIEVSVKNERGQKNSVPPPPIAR